MEVRNNLHELAVGLLFAVKNIKILPESHSLSSTAVLYMFYTSVFYS